MSERLALPLIAAAASVLTIFLVELLVRVWWAAP